MSLRKEKSKFSVTRNDESMVKLVKFTDQKILAVWAIDCAERVLHYFEEKYPQDHRPRQAIETLKTWIDTGVCKMAVIRKASLDAHSAAREAGEDSPARSAARAAGQAVATAHVSRHAYGPAIYAQQAIHRATNSVDSDAAVAKERNWQYQHLLILRKKYMKSAKEKWKICSRGHTYRGNKPCPICWPGYVKNLSHLSNIPYILKSPYN